MTIPSFFSPTRTGAALLGLLVYFATPWASLGAVAGLLGPPFFFAWTVLVPGRALAARLDGGSEDGFEAAGEAVLMGLAAAMATAFLWALAGWEVSTWCIVAGIVPALLIFAAPARDRTRAPEREHGTARARVARYALAGLLVLLCTAVLAGGPPMDFKRDTLDYVAYTNEVAATGEAFPITEFYRDPGADGADLRKGLLHAWYGGARAWLAVDTVYLLAWMAALLLAAAALVVYLAARRLLDDRFAAALSAILFLLCYDGGPASELIRSWFYPSRFGFVVVLALAAAVVDCYRRPGPRRIVVCAALAFTAAAVHIQYAVLAPFLILIVLVGKGLLPPASWGGHIRALIPPGVAVAAGVLPYGAYRYVTAYQASELHTQVQGVVFVKGDWFAVDPLLEWAGSGWLLAAALLCIIPLWPLRRSRAGVGYVMAAVLTVLFIQYNPLVLTPLYGVITYLVHRLDQAMPYFLLPAFFLSVLAAGRMPRRMRASGVLALLCLAVAIAGAVVRLPDGLGITPAARARIGTDTPMRWRDGLHALATRIPPGSVIASDPVTSYAVTAFTPHYVLSTLDQHAPPNDRLAPIRMAAARDILSPFTPAADRVELMRYFGVTHVVLNPDVPAGMILDYFTMDPSIAGLTAVELDRWPGVFQRVPMGDGLTLYKLVGPMPPRVEPPQNPFLARGLPDDARVVDASAGEVHLRAARLESQSVARGTTLGVQLFWEARSAHPPGKYIVSIRLDYLGLELPMGGRPFPKLARKLRERVEGRRYRARGDHMIAWGFFGPDAWPQGALVRDPSSMRVPDDLAPGRYTVRAKMLLAAHGSNHRLRDFFYDDDVYSGVPIGEIEVR